MYNFFYYLRKGLRFLISIMLDILYFGKYKHTYYDKSVELKGKIKFGRRCIFRQGCKIMGDCTFGDNVEVHQYAQIRTTKSQIRIGDNTSFAWGSLIAGKVNIGSNTIIGSYVTVSGSNHTFSDHNKLIKEQGVNIKGVNIGDNVYIASRSIILDGVTIGSHSVIGAGSVVTKDIPPYSVVVGNPARVIKTRQ